MEIKIPELSLVTLIGISGSGKSTFAQRHFSSTEIVSSDKCRGIVSDDENNQAATNDAFELLHYIAGKRLKNGLLTVVDATNVQMEGRKQLVSLAKEYHCLPVAIVLDLPEKVCQERNQQRPDRNFKGYVLSQQRSQLKRSVKSLKKEGFRHIYVLKSEEEVQAITNIQREKLYNDKRDITGPFDIIGDIHGCYAELCELLDLLGFQIEMTADTRSHFGINVTHPAGRKVIFLGDLVDRGPDSPAVLKLVMSMVGQGVAYCVPGNHDMKLQKKLNGKDVTVRHGLEKTLEQLEGESNVFKNQVKEFLYGLVSHYVLDGGRLVVAHAGVKENMQGRGSGAVRAFCMFGETTGETDEFGLPVRYNWASDYRGKAMVVYGHTPIPEPQWLNKTINIDTGCVFGGKLTALRYPDETMVSVPAKQVYSEPVRPLIPVDELKLNQQQEHDDILDLEDVTGKRIINTRLRNNISIREENSVAALEVMSRFAVNSKWLIYLPPTMSPTETSHLPTYLEHPLEVFRHFKSQGLKQVVCEEKHMGSRVILVMCQNEEVATKRFGVENEGFGICYTRTGRNFFNDISLEKAFLERVNNCLSKANFWEKFETDWVCLDAELMPWSAKAQSLLKDQYAAVGASAKASLSAVNEVLEMAQNRNIEGLDLLQNSYKQKHHMVADYTAAYQQYCWPVNNLDEYKLAPFHILASEGNVFADRDHIWHMETIAEIFEYDPQMMKVTSFKLVNLDQEESVQKAVSWWEELTENGGEGMVVKPLDFLSYGKKGLVQPAIKCRGREYLRIIYGPEYTAEQNLLRLKNRSLSHKQSMAIREMALGIEALERFVNRSPLRKVHECVFGVLALESEPIDPRL